MADVFLLDVGDPGAVGGVDHEHAAVVVGEPDVLVLRVELRHGHRVRGVAGTPAAGRAKAAVGARELRPLGQREELNETGAATIAQHLEGLTDHICDSVAGKNYEIVSSRAPDEKSHIVCIRHRDGLTSNEIAEHLVKEKIVVSPRGDRLRIAPHFYNVREEIDRLVETLP